MAKTVVDKLLFLTTSQPTDLKAYSNVMCMTKESRDIYEQYLKDHKELLNKYWMMISFLDEKTKQAMDSAFTHEEKLRISLIYDFKNRSAL